MVVHGEPGLDEISPVGETDVIELNDGVLTRYRIRADKLVGKCSEDLDELAGGSPDHNAAVVAGVLRGEIRGVARAAVILNAAAAIYVAGSAETLEVGVRAAEAALDSHAGSDMLDRLRAASTAARS
jgi:anthranilate phosphoribosyltransferase